MLRIKYRFYPTDMTRKFYEARGTADWFEAADDDDAVAQAKARHPGETGEVWIGPRLVAIVAPEVLQVSENIARRA
jgi:hypothetical protein